MQSWLSFASVIGLHPVLSSARFRVLYCNGVTRISKPMLTRYKHWGMKIAHIFIHNHQTYLNLLSLRMWQ